MAELIGALASGITLAGLFKICVDAFGIIRTCKNQERELKKLTLRLNIERCRLYNWGEAMRLTQSDKHRSPLDDYPNKNIVQQTLETIFQLLNDTQKIKSKYGCHEVSDLKDTDDKPMELEGPEESPVTVLAASFSNFGNITNAKPQTLHKTRWVVYDRKKFNLLMIELKELVDALQDITEPLVSVTKLGSMMRKAIRSIKDVDTLTLVSEVTQEDHPDLSVAASTKAETVSMPASTWRDIAGWNKEVHAHNGAHVDITEEIEDMDITELKVRLLRDSLEKQHRQHEYRPPSRDSPTDRRTFDNQYLNMSVNPMFRPETSDRVPHHPTYQRTAWSQDQGQDLMATSGNLSQQQMYDLHAYKLKLEVSALEEAAKEAAAKAAAAAAKKVSTEENTPAEKAPIMFHDAYQRAYKLPFELCTKWRGMESMIVQAHQGFDAAELVMQCRYDLLGPSGEVIMPHVWDAIVEPGWDITLKPWPTPEPEPEPPPPPDLDDTILALDDILNPKKRSKDPTGKARPRMGSFASWMSGGVSSTSEPKSTYSTTSSSRRTIASSEIRRRR